ncbi:MAG TPA: MBL fold metallo-hydrolase [Ignavibacteriaceae bacterium]|nr:MBL fold metallo-hydrolase [Ignavibacteriaceae bacterium]
MINFLPLGGAGEIGASCFYLNINGTGIILDCGMHPLKSGLDALPKFDLIKDLPVDYVLISHAHQDHLSALPFLVQRHPYVIIISTPQTRALAELTLHNSVSILKEQILGEDLNGSPAKQMKIYSHEEIDLLIKSIEYKAYSENFILKGYNHQGKIPIIATLIDAGHILGSAAILLEYNGKKIIYTGDIKLSNQAVTPGSSIPSTKIDTLILETTYGSTDSSLIPDWNDEALRLALSINRVLISGGSVLIPVFSLGKMQEMITVVWNLIKAGKILLTDIYTGGIASKISRVYDYNRYVVNRIDPEFEISSIPVKNFYEVTQPEDFFKNPCIIFAASGMMIEGTASFKLAQQWLKHEHSAIFTVGFMEESTPGFRIARARHGDKIRLTDFSDESEVKCEINNFRFPSHSTREELLEIVKRVKPAKVVLVHGSQESIDWIGAAILINFKEIKVFQAELGKEIILEKIEEL